MTNKNTPSNNTPFCHVFRLRTPLYSKAMRSSMNAPKIIFTPIGSCHSNGNDTATKDARANIMVAKRGGWFKNPGWAINKITACNTTIKRQCAWISLR